MSQSLPSAGVAGEAAAAWLLRLRTGVPLGAVIGTLTARRFLLALGHGLTLALALVVVLLVPLRVPRLIAPLLAVSAAAMLVLGFIGPAVIRRANPFARLHVVLRRVPWAGLRVWLDGSSVRLPEADRQAARVFRRPDGPWVGAAVLYLAMYLSETLETWILLRVLGVDVPLLAVLTVEPLLSLLRAVVFFVPAGLGVQDVGYVAVLIAWGVPDVAAVGPAFILLKRLKELIWMAIGWSILLAAGGARTVATPDGSVTPKSFAGNDAVTGLP